MASIFTRIIQGELPAHKIAENDLFFCFLDIFPLTQGHTLVVPKKEVDYIFDLDDKTLSELHIFSKKIAVALKKAVPCLRIGTAVIGLEVPHAHLHLLPLNSMADIDFTRPKLKPSSAELAQTAAKIKSFLNDI